MSAVKRARWKLICLGAVWPAWTMFRTFVWHSPYADDVADVGSVITLALITVAAAGSMAVPELRHWRRKRQNLALKAHLAQHETKAYARINELEDRLAGLEEGVGRVFTVTGHHPPPSPDSPTEPIYLPSRRRATG